MTFVRFEEEPDEDPLEPDHTFGLLNVGSYAYTVLYERARKLPKKGPFGFSIPSPPEDPT